MAAAAMRRRRVGSGAKKGLQAMSDGRVFILLLLGSTISSGILGYGLARFRPRWSRRRIVFLSASFVPGPLAALLVFAFLHSLITGLTAPERCGVDACSMVMMASMIGLAAALLSFGAAAFVASLSVGSRHR
ncbi:hypothetical protein LH20_16555 [Sphingopyxis sp. 113P3]|nr:hypothetical protein LH20_16555 [Sphingopyxis sp. 113P3]